MLAQLCFFIWVLNFMVLFRVVLEASTLPFHSILHPALPVLMVSFSRSKFWQKCDNNFGAWNNWYTVVQSHYVLKTVCWGNSHAHVFNVANEGILGEFSNVSHKTALAWSALAIDKRISAAAMGSFYWLGGCLIMGLKVCSLNVSMKTLVPAATVTEISAECY